MNRDLIDRYCERGILALVLMILVAGPLSAGAVATRELVMLMTLTVGVLGLWLVRLWVNERPKVLWPPVCWAVLAFAVYAAWRYTTSDIEYLGRLEVLRVLVYAALFFAIINNLHRQEITQIIGFTLIFLAMVIAACGIWQFMTRADKVPALSALVESFFFEHKTWYFARVYLDRASGSYINPNHLAGLLEMLLPLAMAYVVAGRARPVTKIFLGYAALVMLTGIAVTGSRGSWAATGLSLFLLFAVMATHRSYRLPAIAMLVILIGGGIYLVAQNNPFRERLAKTFVGGEVELDMRSDIWTAATVMWRDHPWLGVGPGHFNARWREYRPQRVQLQPDRAHNDYLNLLVDWGVVGGVIVAGLLVALALGVRKTWGHVRRSERDFKSNRSDKFAFVAGATFGLVALAVHAVVEFNLHIPANAIIAVTLAALLCSHVRFATEQHWAGAGVALKSVISLFLFVGLIGLTHQSLRMGREYVWLTHSSGKENYSDDKIRDLEKAHAIEPWNFETTFALGEC
jgi:O-antigen ligase